MSQAQLLSEKYVYNHTNFCAHKYEGIAPQPDFKSFDGIDHWAAIYPATPGGGSEYEYAIVTSYKFYDLQAIERKLYPMSIEN